MSIGTDFLISSGRLIRYDGPGGDVVIPEGVTAISSFVFEYNKDITSICLPASLECLYDASFSGCTNLASITLAADNPHFKLVDGVLFDKDMKILFLFPTGRGDTEYTVPRGVAQVFPASFPRHLEEFHLHLSEDVTSMGLSTCTNTVFHAPPGSYAERFAKARYRYNSRYEPEGEPVAPDESSLRRERSLKQWREYFTISTRAKGLNISAYVRSSKIVYLPDVMGNTEVATVANYAFPPDVTVLCSKRLFSKLHENNRNATIRSYLVDRELFTEEEQTYLLAYLKKNRAAYLEKYIKEEDFAALGACLEVMPRVRTLMDECLELTQKLGATSVNFFLLQHGREAKGVQ